MKNAPGKKNTSGKRCSLPSVLLRSPWSLVKTISVRSNWPRSAKKSKRKFRCRSERPRKQQSRKD